jgi:hypothetical protein
MKNINLAYSIFFIFFVSSCAMQETPRNVEDISSKNIKTLTTPKISKSDSSSIQITYATMSMGYASGCNPFRSFSDEKNDCAELPENVKTIAMDHCESYDKKAVFLGNKKNLLQMTVSVFRCE